MVVRERTIRRTLTETTRLAVAAKRVLVEAKQRPVQAVVGQLAPELHRVQASQSTASDAPRLALLRLDP